MGSVEHNIRAARTFGRDADWFVCQSPTVEEQGM